MTAQPLPRALLPQQNPLDLYHQSRRRDSALVNTLLNAVLTEGMQSLEIKQLGNYVQRFNVLGQKRCTGVGLTFMVCNVLYFLLSTAKVILT